jgi:hypothetical protein
MGLIDRLKQAYKNGKARRFLEEKDFSYSFMFVIRPKVPHPKRFLYDLLDETAKIHKEKARIPKPKGFLEELAYNFGKNSEGFLSSV